MYTNSKVNIMQTKQRSKRVVYVKQATKVLSSNNATNTQVSKQTIHNNNVVTQTYTCKQLYNNKQVYNTLSANMQKVINLYKHYNITIAQLHYIQAFYNNKISKTIYSLKIANKLYNEM